MANKVNLGSVTNSINVIDHVNKLENKKHMIISVDAEKSFNKIQHLSMIKNQFREEEKWIIPQHNTGHI